MMVLQNVKLNCKFYCKPIYQTYIINTRLIRMLSVGCETPSSAKKSNSKQRNQRRSPRSAFSASSVFDQGFHAGLGEHTCGEMYKVPGYIVWDHEFTVPLDWMNDSGNETITIFAREIVSNSKLRQNLPYLLYLQGGPGFAAPLPIDGGAWLKQATNYFKVVLMDQRGTGRSTPVTCQNLKKIESPQLQAQYLTHFRSDSIVKDAEFIRKSLVPIANQGGKWSILGQSYGGFCCIHYLSAAPEGLNEVFMTGGIPPLISEKNPSEKVYETLFKRVCTQNEKFYKRFPGDKDIVHDLICYLMSQPNGHIKLPSGSKLTPRSFQLLGCTGLGFAGGFERLHYLLGNAFDGDSLSFKFMKDFENWMPWESNPLYYLLHETIYTQGPSTQWAAERVYKKYYRDIFDPEMAVKEGRPVYFTGEMVFSWMADDFKELSGLKKVAHLLAEYNDWPQLYNLKGLKDNNVPIASATYCEDLYVDFDLAQESVKHIGNIRQWMTNEFMHSGLREEGERIFERLLAIARDSILLN